MHLSFGEKIKLGFKMKRTSRNGTKERKEGKNQQNYCNEAKFLFISVKKRAETAPRLKLIKKTRTLPNHNHALLFPIFNFVKFYV